MKSRCTHHLGNLVLILALLALPTSSLAGASLPVENGPDRPLPPVLPAWFSPPDAAQRLPAQTLRKIEPALLKQLLYDPNARVHFIVRLAEQADLSAAKKEASVLARRQHVVAALQTTAERTQADLRAFLLQEQAAGRAADVRPFWIFNGLALTAGRETALALAARPEVETLLADHLRRLPDSLSSAPPASGALFQAPGVEWNIERIRAPLVWDVLGFDGSGIVVANIDSGVDWLHPALQTRYRGYDPHGAHQHVGNWFDATGQGVPYPADDNSHGTHTMGTIVGGEGVGVAPGARWIAGRAFNNAGVGYDSWLHATFEWLLAPAGDPALAPDVVNNSWGNDDGSSQVFRDDVRALRQAGIMVVFSAGNNGPGVGSIASPASYPESLAVGATDVLDDIAGFSSRGPSPWNEIKPEISAPGVAIRSTLPGGNYGLKQGTSMAAPHVAGVLALMLQADASLTFADAEDILARTAVPRPSPSDVPNNDYGWGRVDAYDAVQVVAARGILSGVVTRASDGLPIPQAAVSAVPSQGGAAVQTTTDAQGSYLLGLTAGLWDVTASAFGYQPQTVNRLALITGTITLQDFALIALPTGLLSGTVVEAGSNAPLSATLRVVNTPAWAATDPASGAYSLSLPVGVYTVSARSPGHRIGRAADVPINVNQTTIQNFALVTAPTILLIDSGGWYYDSQIGYYQVALEELNYPHDTWTIRNLPQDVPASDDLLPYDVVIWSAPGDGPGYVGASTALTLYLESGGRLLLSGQDVGFWDGAGSGVTFAPYYRDYLYARFIADNAASRQVQGLDGDLFAGLAFSIAGGDGANNQRYPDVITAYNADYATAVFQYQDDGSAGQRVGLCRPYRALYFSFGFEGINSAAARREVMQRAIDWFTGPRQAQGVELAPQTLPTQVALPGETVTHVLRLRNTGETQPADTYDLALASLKGWSYALSEGSLALSSCLTATLTVTAIIPPTARWDEADVVTVTARSRSAPTVAASTVLTSKTPAPILLVDDDRWYDMEGHYTSALQVRRYRYDVWDTEARGWRSPPAEILRLYPMLVWYTAYDWFSPLTPDEEARLIAYLQGGGRLFFSSQDYLYVSGLTPLGQDFFGLAGATQDLTTTVASGLRGSIIGDRLGPFPLTYPFQDWSDAIEPALVQDEAFFGQHGGAVGVSHAEGNHKTVFFSFPFEALDDAACSVTIERVVGWLNWLGDSTFAVSKELAADGETLPYTLTLRNDGLDDVALAVVTNTLPADLDLLPGSLTPVGASYTNGVVRWQGPLAQGEEVTIRYQAQLASPMPVASQIMNPAMIHLVDQDLIFTRTARTRVNAPDLAASLYTVDRSQAHPGEVLTYTLLLRNDGLAAAPAAWLTNPLPFHTSYLTGSLALQGGGAAGEADGVITWTGALALGQPVTLTYQALIAHDGGYNIVGRASLSDGYGEVWQLVARTAVDYFKLYFPLVFKQLKISFWPLEAP